MRWTGGLVWHQQQCRHSTVEVKRELSQSIYVPAITSGHELWVVTIRM